MADPQGPILPRVKTTAFLEASKAIPGMTEDDLPVVRAMAGELVLAFGVDTDEGYTFVTRGMARRRGLDEMGLLSEALGNLQRVADRLTVKNLGPAYQVLLPEDLAAASFFLHDFWEQMAAQLGAAPLAVFAHRNFVAFTSVADEKGRAFLEYAAAKAGGGDVHGLSRQLFSWAGHPIGWRTWPDAGVGEDFQVYPQPVDDWFEDRDGNGFLSFPARFLCPDCQEVTFVFERERLEGALLARRRGGPPTTTLPPEAVRALAPVACEFIAPADARFCDEVSCAECGMAGLVGYAAVEGVDGALRFRPLAVWTAM